MKPNKFLTFIRLNIFILPIALVISYFIVPIFSVSSPCYDLASSPSDPTVLSVPCIKLTTIPQYYHPQYVTKFSFHYQSNAFYTYDLSAKYVSPILNGLFAYFFAWGIVFSVMSFYTFLKEKKIHR